MPPRSTHLGNYKFSHVVPLPVVIKDCNSSEQRSQQKKKKKKRLIVLGFNNTRQPLWVSSCRLPENGRKEMEEIVEEMKERDREERGTRMKVKNQWK